MIPNTIKVPPVATAEQRLSVPDTKKASPIIIMGREIL